MNGNEDSSDELYDWEYPDEPDEYDEQDDFEEQNGDSETLTRPCPACGVEVYEDIEQCPVCGEFITFSTSPWQGRSVLWIVLGTLGVVATVLALTLAGSIFH